MSQEPVFGQLVTDPDAKRDAIHVASAPTVAPVPLRPGQQVDAAGRPATRAGGAVGIVDPFLLDPVDPGQRFWLFLFPRSVVGLRHAWSHPAYADDVDPRGHPAAAE